MFANAHEVAFGLLFKAHLKICQSMDGRFASDVLGKISRKELCDKLHQFEKQASIRSVLESCYEFGSIRAWIIREWAAVSFMSKQARLNVDTVHGIETELLIENAGCQQTIEGDAMATSNPNHNNSRYLGITLGDREASRSVNGESYTSKFDRKMKSWEMFCFLFKAGGNGLSRAEIGKKLWPSNAVTENTLDQHKATANAILVNIRVEIKPDNRGVWRLEDLNT